MSSPQGTLPQKLLHWARVQPDAIAFRQKDYGIWQAYTWADYARLARHFGLGLTRLGLPHGGHVAVLSENRKEWVIAQLGLGMVGASPSASTPPARRRRSSTCWRPPTR
jgi:long-chain acyl-CoA synthetase